MRIEKLGRESPTSNLSDFDLWRQWKSSDDNSTSFSSYKKSLSLAGGAQDEATKFDTWLNSVSSFKEQVSTDYESRNGKYQDTAQLDDYRTEKGSQIDDLLKNASEEQDYFINNRDQLSELYGKDTVDKIIETLHNQTKDLGNIRVGLNEEYNQWSQFESEEDYNKKLADKAEIERLSSLDLNSVQQQIDEL